MPVIRSLGYNVVIGKTAFTALNTFLKKQRYNSYFILCDENTLNDCLPVLITSCPALASAEILEMESGEENKSLELTAQLLQTLIENKADRHSLFINLGGGVVSDLGGFTASIYKRGIDFINVPTSLLAMVDASVGGKTGIDFAGVKNSVGTFCQPKAVFAHPVFLNTLPRRHFDSGLAEVYKIALVSDKTFWEQIIKHVQKTPEAMITQSVSLKNTLVLKDPFDKGVRKALNFGHTIGHALEALSLKTEYELLHGEAVVVGMIVESHIAFQKKMITKTELFEITRQLQFVYRILPSGKIPEDAILNIMQQDKKNTGNKLMFALVKHIGSCATDVAVTEAQIKKGLTYYYQLT